jgi:uncharacterized membrane protein YgdD (TMEM256/DUF423 family)
MRFWIIVAACSGALSVAAGAFGAHGLKARVDPELLLTWQTAAQYHQLHSVFLMVLALFALASEKSVHVPAGLASAGIILFSGSLYLLVLTGSRWLGAVTPVGGVLLIAGWLSLLLLLRS